MTAPILSVRGLQAGYGRAQVLFDINFDVYPGQVVTLLGRNGMGRSTTIKCLFGMLPTLRGDIQVDGRSTRGLASHRIARQGLALVPEGRQVFSNLSVEENLVATARVAAVATQATAWTLSRVYECFPRLQERRTNMGWQLSGGEQQMLAIGRALMTNPRLLVLDEATEGLAPLIREEIWRCLSALRGQGQTILVIDKYVQRLVRLADRHTIIERGRVVWQGDSAQLGADPSLWHRYIGV